MPATIINGKKVLFIHIPKSGGSTIETVLSKLSDEYGNGRLDYINNIKFPSSKNTMQHMDGDQLRSLFDLRDFDFIFTVIRDPLSRIKSEFRWQLHKPWAHNGFDKWYSHVQDVYKKNNSAFDNHLKPQWNFLVENIKIFRFENGMRQIVEDIEDLLGVGFYSKGNEIPHEQKDALNRKIAQQPEIANFLKDSPSENCISKIFNDYNLDYELLGYEKRG